MKEKRLFTLVIVIIVCSILIQVKEPVAKDTSRFEENEQILAYYYDFNVTYMTTNITIFKDGSIDIFYELKVTCRAFGQPIDVFDIGFPNNHYQLSSVRAWLDGVEISKNRIKKSEYIDIGVEIWLNDVGFIDPGETAVLKVF
ncbi:MAG: hypothetical protein ACTSSG_02760, partial [Candidatus Heimdallarchaeaceae archaeon]